MSDDKKKQADVQQEKELTETSIEQFKDELKEKADATNIEELVARNEFTFEHEDVMYRVRKPTFKEKQDAYKKQGLKFTELLDNDEYKLEAVLKDIYKKKGIDIDAMDRRMQDLNAKKTDHQMKLGKLLKEGGGKDSDLEAYKKEIEALQDEAYEISIKKSQMLQFSIENQTLLYIYQYITFLVLEKQNENEEWIKAFDTFEDFQNVDEELITVASFNASLLVGKL